MAIPLAKALKLKNRQVAKIQKLQGIVTTHNSRLVGGSEEFDVAASLAELRNATETLVKLKAAISLANAPIQETIYRIGELKSHITFLRRIPTTSGKFMQPYGMQEPQEYIATLTAREVEEEVSRLEAEIDELQDRLDEHNATVSIEFSE
jgi:uncharacterized protein YicC (UPF0701 family)